MLANLATARWNQAVRLRLTKMANKGVGPETNEDVSNLVKEIIAEKETKVIFMPVALCDYEGSIVGSRQESTPSGKDKPRLKTSDGPAVMYLTPADKVIGQVRKERKDIFLVGFKTTAGATPEEQYVAALTLLKKNSCNLVFANDIHTKLCMIVTPEQARYHESTNKSEVLKQLVDMAYLRSQNNFTRSTVVDGEPVPWASEAVPESLRTAVNHCIARGAYKPFMGSTVGHFAVKTGPGEFLTSRRKTNFNQLDRVGLVKVVAEGLTQVTAYGSKPSVGGQSQRIIFEEHPDTDCILHFHCRLRKDAPARINVMSQKEFECGSHGCGKNTSIGLKDFDGIKAVYLQNHGPNIVFSRTVDPEKLIRFIEDNFDLSTQTGNLAFEPDTIQFLPPTGPPYNASCCFPLPTSVSSWSSENRPFGLQLS